MAESRERIEQKLNWFRWFLVEKFGMPSESYYICDPETGDVKSGPHRRSTEPPWPTDVEDK